MYVCDEGDRGNKFKTSPPLLLLNWSILPAVVYHRRIVRNVYELTEILMIQGSLTSYSIQITQNVHTSSHENIPFSTC